MEAYLDEQKKSVENYKQFWDQKSKILDWFKNYKTITSGSFREGNVKWYEDGKLNACYNCVDRHLELNANTVAIIGESDDESFREITFASLHENVCRLANVLKQAGVVRGDVVCIYMPMIPEAAFAMLACARIGAVHNVVFGGFSPESLRDRIVNSECRILISADYGMRGGKKICLLKNAEEAVKDLSSEDFKSILAFKRHNDAAVPENYGRVVWINEILNKASTECPAEVLGSEDPLFVLYTSGSTGKPKGLVHTTGGYCVYAAETHKTVFDIRKGDVFGCVADVGWITGHTYVVYGPLLNGVTTVMFESTPMYPEPDRYWKLIEKHKITQFYTSPTAIRSIQKFGESYLEGKDLSSLRVIGSVGEPINSSAWQWYHKAVGRGLLPIVDTYWQTEMGGIAISAVPGRTMCKPCSASLPLPGIDPVIVDPLTLDEVPLESKGVLCLRTPWPGVARTVFRNHKSYIETYFSLKDGMYYTGDEARRDEEGYFFITGRVDDVISISGHRIGTSEIETAITKDRKVVECAVIGVDDEIRGQKWLAFCVMKSKKTSTSSTEIRQSVREHVGSFASLGDVVFVDDLPKTRSGKIMRRILRKIATNEMKSIGDLSTLTDAAVVERIAENLQSQIHNRAKSV